MLGAYPQALLENCPKQCTIGGPIVNQSVLPIDPRNPRDYERGPGDPCNPHPVANAYIDTHAIEFDCTNCQVPHGEFCRRADGTRRKVPCATRIMAAVRAARKCQASETTGGAA